MVVSSQATHTSPAVIYSKHFTFIIPQHSPPFTEHQTQEKEKQKQKQQLDQNETTIYQSIEPKHYSIVHSTKHQRNAENLA